MQQPQRTKCRLCRSCSQYQICCQNQVRSKKTHVLHVEQMYVLLQFNMPIEISWEYMDTQLLQRFWSGHPHLQTETADISERMLVFHRGIHTVS